MKEFNLTALLTISISTTVKAESAAEARAIASQRTDILNSQFEFPDSTQHWVAEGYDGEPYNIRLEKD